MKKTNKTKQELKLEFDLSENNTEQNQEDSTIESPNKFVLFPTEEDGLMKLYKKQQEEAQEAEKKNNDLDEPFNLDAIF